MTDFEELHIVSVSVIGILRCDPQQQTELTTEIQKHRKSWPRYSLKRLGLAVCEGFAKHIDFSLMRGRKESQNIRARLEVHQVASLASMPARSRNKQLRALDDIADILGAIERSDIQSQCHAHVSWDYEPGSHTTIIDLPMLHTAGSAMPFDFISGVRFIRESSLGDISVIVDATREGRLIATAQIPLDDNLSLPLVDKVAKQATDIVGDFIIETPV